MNCMIILYLNLSRLMQNFWKNQCEIARQLLKSTKFDAWIDRASPRSCELWGYMYMINHKQHGVSCDFSEVTKKSK